MKKYLSFVVFFLCDISFAVPISVNCTIHNIYDLSKPIKFTINHICKYMGKDALFIFDYANIPSSIVKKITDQNFYIIDKLFSSIAMSYSKFQQLTSSPSENINSVILNSKLQPFDKTPWIANILNTTQPTLITTYVSSVNQLFDGMGKTDKHSHKSFEDCYIYSVYTIAGVVITAILIGATCGVAVCLEKRRQKKAFPSLIGNSISP